MPRPSLLLAALLAVSLTAALARPEPTKLEGPFQHSDRLLAEKDRTTPFPDPGPCDKPVGDQAHQLCCFTKMRNAEITGKPKDWHDDSCFDLRLYNGRPCSVAVQPAAFRLCCTDKRARSPFAKPGFQVDPSCPKAA